MTIPTLLGWLTTIFFNASYIPQIVKIVKTKQVNDISLGYLVFLLAAYTCGLTYSLSIQAWPIVISHLIGVSFALCYFWLYFKYKRN